MNYTSFLFFSSISYGMEGKTIFRGKALQIIEKVEGELKKKPLSEVLNYYTNEKSKCANILLRRIGETITRL